jgi:hypothetical protein
LLEGAGLPGAFERQEPDFYLKDGLPREILANEVDRVWDNIVWVLLVVSGQEVFFN